jgi:hypothetical protein
MAGQPAARSLENASLHTRNVKSIHGCDSRAAVDLKSLKKSCWSAAYLSKTCKMTVNSAMDPLQGTTPRIEHIRGSVLRENRVRFERHVRWEHHKHIA